MVLRGSNEDVCELIPDCPDYDRSTMDLQSGWDSLMGMMFMPCSRILFLFIYFIVQIIWNLDLLHLNKKESTVLSCTFEVPRSISDFRIPDQVLYLHEDCEEDPLTKLYCFGCTHACPWSAPTRTAARSTAILRGPPFHKGVPLGLRCSRTCTCIWCTGIDSLLQRLSS